MITEQDMQDYIQGMHGHQLQGCWYADYSQVEREASARADRRGEVPATVWHSVYLDQLAKLQTYPPMSADMVPLTLLALCADNRQFAEEEANWLADQEEFAREYEDFLDEKQMQFYSQVEKNAI